MTLDEAVVALAAVSDTPELDAKLLLEHALATDAIPASLSPSAGSGETLSKGFPSSSTGQEGRGFDRLSQVGDLGGSFDSLIGRRLAHEPVAYITGTRGFWTIEVEVARGVLIPRADSETLIEAAVAHCPSPKRILDLGTGSGALLLAALDQWPEATGLGIDASEAALAIARRNGERIAPGRAVFHHGDWAEGIDERFDLVLCNPPYVEDGAELDRQVRDWEPSKALFAGSDGLDAYRRIAPQIGSLMSGMACIEIGWTQRTAVAALFEAEGCHIECHKDLAGRDRCLVIHFK